MQSFMSGTVSNGYFFAGRALVAVVEVVLAFVGLLRVGLTGALALTADDLLPVLDGLTARFGDVEVVDLAGLAGAGVCGFCGLRLSCSRCTSMWTSSAHMASISLVRRVASSHCTTGANLRRFCCSRTCRMAFTRSAGNAAGPTGCRMPPKPCSIEAAVSTFLTALVTSEVFGFS